VGHYIPPSAVSINMLSQKNNKSNGYQKWNFDCHLKQINVDSGQATRIPVGENSLRNLWLNGFCGVTNDTGSWYYVGSFKEGNMMTSYYVDSSSVRRTSPPEKDGAYFKIAPGIFEHSTTSLRIEKIFEVITPCNGYSVAEMREKGQAEYINQSIVKNVPGDSALNLICKNYFPSNAVVLQKNDVVTDTIEKTVQGVESKEIPAQDKESLPSANDKLIEAKAKCKDLGFKDKTEKFGACVLRLSK
jgi:hypothetical protein